MPKTKTAYDGTPLWLCDLCHGYKRRKDLAVHTEREVVCKMCAAPKEARSSNEFRMNWVLGPKPFNEEQVHKVLWRYARPFVLRCRLKPNRDKVNEAGARERTLRQIIGSRSVSDSLREPVFQVLSGFDLQPKDNIWLAFRKDVLNKVQLRLLAILCAEQAAQATSLYDDYPIAYAVFSALRRFAENPENQRLHIPRQNAFSIQEDMAKQDYVSLAGRYAADALFATCFPSSKDAAIVSLSWTFESFLSNGMDEKVALATLSDIVRELAEVALQDFAKPELEHWGGPEEL